MRVAKIVIFISKTVEIFREYNNVYSNACNNANKISNAYINVNKNATGADNNCLCWCDILVGCLIFIIYFNLKNIL